MAENILLDVRYEYLKGRSCTDCIFTTTQLF